MKDTRRFVLKSLLAAQAGALPARAADGSGAMSPGRQSAAVEMRLRAAQRLGARTLPAQQSNGDEDRYPNFIASFTKGLAHDQSGEVSPAAFESLRLALKSGKPSDFALIQRGSGRQLVNPQGGFAFSLEGLDPHMVAAPPAPAFASAEAAAEMAELYWMAAARDVPFDQYENSPVIRGAVDDLNKLSAHAGPGGAGGVTPGNIFRGNLDGDLDGPYLSQFLWRPLLIGSRLPQLYREPIPGQDFLDNFGEWLQLQSGIPPFRSAIFDPTPLYLRGGRALAEYVHYDFLYQAFLNAALALTDMGPEQALNVNQFYSETNPYKHSKIETGFVTLGMAQSVDWVARVTTASLKATWAQKWIIHRRLRPEEFGGRVHLRRKGLANYPVHSQLLSSTVLDLTEQKSGGALLSQAYPEGCPLHPAYPAGHATVAGAGATILKAIFDENQTVPDCVTPDANGTKLIPRTDLGLTVGGELNKLASNIALGRSFAGIHYRSDYRAGLAIGEAIAIGLLEDLAGTLNEDFPGFQFTRFDGRKITIARIS